MQILYQKKFLKDLASIINFLENITNCKVLINSVKILIKKGVYYKCQIILTKYNLVHILLIMEYEDLYIRLSAD